MVWHKLAVPLHQKLNEGTMRNTDYNNVETLSNMISSNDSLQALKGLMEDLGLEFEDALSL